MQKREMVRDQKGALVEATRAQIVRIAPSHTELELDDGTIVEVHVLPIAVFRIDGQTDPDGNQVYSLNSQLVLKIQSPASSAEAQGE